MQTRHEIDLRRQQQAGHEVGAIVTVGQQDVARTQSSQQLAQQSALAGLFPGIGPDGQVADHRRRQRQQHHKPRQRKTEPRLLRRGLRILGLIGFGVRHAARAAIDQLHVAPMPEP